MGDPIGHAGLIQRIFFLICCVSITNSFHRRLHIPSRNQAGWGSETAPDMLVNILRDRGDTAAETNAHRIILSVDTASNFINDVLESAMTKTFHSAISSRENLFFSLQRSSNDSRRIFELVDRATSVVSNTAKKAKAEINDAIDTSLDHLRESMKIIIRNVPESKLTETTLAAIISNGQYRMEVVVENSGQRIIDAIQSYRSHFIAIDKDTGFIMVDPESSQEATEAVKHIITAAKSQIQEAVSGSTSFILSRIRDSLSSNLNDDSTTNRLTITTTSPLTVTVGFNGSSETFQAEVISVHQTQMEDPQDDKLVLMGDIPSRPTTDTSQTLGVSQTTQWELPMVINTKWTTLPPVDGGPGNWTVDDGQGNGTVAPSTPRLVSWQDDIPKGSFPATTAEQAFMTPETSPKAAVELSTDGSVTVSNNDSSSGAITVTQGPLIRRRIHQIKPIAPVKDTR